ncbi:hypothetical protein [Rhizobium ruizarguesonis]|uniref:hypothetical protein n=1 Tax=Rhizobium ruizarguesonis TaxID=2081791 RepID=UPI0013E011A5|nr:hypothetical protein [Rhizobium ruizarguesonis]MBY5891671.1 hypothetical protein [Rhizobium leguminosarum]NEI81565.1 hypothetical protein [Rhizobium ruizarguesonis]QSZ05590.1 hypothetical protein J3P73_37235 [Rhizobium ruizarguesonis]
MLQRPAIIDELQVILSEWVVGLESPKPIGAYLFGSTVNDGGVRFDPKAGDLDVIVVLDWDRVPPGERVEQINGLRQAKEELENRLFRKLRREKGSEKIVSLVPVTPFEIEHAVHKDNVKHILTDARAFDLLEKCEIAGLNGGRASHPLSDAHRSVLAFLQKKRAEALSVSPNGGGGLKVEPHGDPVPKELMRNFAVATAEPGIHQDISDIARGLQGISHFARDAAGWTPMTSAFAQWLGVKMGERGSVDPVISSDHYLLLIETIYDQVRVQYAGDTAIRYVGPGPISAPPKHAPPTPALPSTHRLESTFRVTKADKLGGTKTDILRAVRAARANMKARVSNPFELLFEEDAKASTLFEIDDVDLDAKAHRQKVKAFERRTLVAARQARWQQGVELILWYGGTLFRGDEETMEEACRIAIANWFAVAATNVVNPGGMFEAFHLDLYPSYGMALSFSGKPSWVRDDGRPSPMYKLDPMDLARGFVPNLVSKYLHLASQSGRADLQDYKDSVFDIARWDYGLK